MAVKRMSSSLQEIFIFISASRRTMSTTLFDEVDTVFKPAKILGSSFNHKNLCYVLLVQSRSRTHGLVFSRIYTC